MKVGEWIMVPYNGPHLARVEIGLDDNWYAAFLEGGKALIRTPDIDEGEYTLKLRVNDSERTLYSIKVER